MRPTTGSVLATAATMLLAASAAKADLAVSFTESAPKDSFVIENRGACAVEGGRVTVDLSSAAAGVLFDVTAEGAGVEVFQPLVLAEDRAGAVARVSSVKDGDQTMVLELGSLPAGGRIVLTVDIDDVATPSANRQTMVTGAEIAGAIVQVEKGGRTHRGVFGTDARALVPIKAC